MKIKEIIVVEGKDDTTAIKRAVNADTIETNGSAINEETIEKIKLAQETRGVIIFTDPDFPGEKIRKTIAEQVPGCKHAFLPKEAAMQKHGKGLGVEHASPRSHSKGIKGCSNNAGNDYRGNHTRGFTYSRLNWWRGCKRNEEHVGKILKIGYTNGKQLHKRLMMFQISKARICGSTEVIRTGGKK